MRELLRRNRWWIVGPLLALLALLAALFLLFASDSGSPFRYAIF